MPLSDEQRGQLADIQRVPISKVICLARAAYDCYTCVKAANGDVGKIAQCAEKLIADIERCMQ